MGNKLLGLLIIILSSGAIAQQNQTTEPNLVQLEATIRGDKEQPNVLSIVPWQLPMAKTVDGQVLDTVTMIDIQPMTRAQFQRELATFNQPTNRVSEGQPEH